MTTHGTRYKQATSKVDSKRIYDIEEAIQLAKETATADFDESVDLALNLGVNPSQTMIRGTCVLPHGTGSEVTVLAFARGEKQREAEEAGADWVGGEDLVEKVEDGWLEFDEVVSTPDMMGSVGRLGRILGPRGLMPSPKSNTVVDDIGQAVEKLKKGQVEFRTDKYGVVHVPVGKASFSQKELSENIVPLVTAINEQRPEEGLQDRYFQRASVAATMGPGIQLDINELRRRAQDREMKY